MYKIIISPAAEKQLKTLTKKDQSKIIKRIVKLGENPNPNGVKNSKEWLHYFVFVKVIGGLYTRSKTKNLP